jgi:flagellar export protein FliJ
MPNFAFSLQRVLDYRRLEEEWAQEAYRMARTAVAEAESDLDALRARRRSLNESTAVTIAARLDLEACNAGLDREEESAQNRLALLANDESRAAEEWKACRIAAEALAKLRESAYEEWTREETRREQADLDEWAVLRR